MFVVLTVFSIWLGWQAKIVRDRREARKWLEDNGGWSIAAFAHNSFSGDVPAIPFWRKWLGDEPMTDIGPLPDATEQDRKRIKRLFPEAYVSDRG